jgi:hypothetical protein
MDEESLETERLQNITTDADARRYVDRILEISSPFEVLRYVQAYFLPIHRHVDRHKRRQRGGAVEDANDVRVYSFLAACDSIHDAKRVDVDASDIIDVLDVQLPKGWTARMNESQMIDFLRRRKTLWFGEDEVRNPLHKADIQLTKCDDPGAIMSRGRHPIESLATFFHKRTRDLANQRGMRTLPVSVVTEYVGEDHRRQKLQFRQVLLLAYQMRVWFGPRCVFQPDQLHPVIRFVTATSLVGEAFFRKFAVDRTYVLARYAAEIAEVVQSASDSSQTEWRTELSDACVYDGNALVDAFDVSAEPTGDVFRPGSGFQITLGGTDGRKRAHVTFTDGDGTKSVATGSHAAMQRYSSLGSVFDAEARLTPARLARKRAGDWGQVESCSRHGRVFVTGDALAALYAFYRRVPFLLLRMQSLGSFEHYACVLGRA